MKISHWALFLLVILFSQSYNRYKHIGPNNFRSEIWADRAGYYIYLPSLFIYNFDIKEYPDSIVEKTGKGFYLNTGTGKVETIYTYGIALLQTPFFLLADITTSLTNKYPRDGFSFFYRKAIRVAAVFYFVLGMVLLFITLKKFFGFRNQSIIITLLLLFLGSNLYYYSIGEAGMSHVYSFFLFSCLLWIINSENRFTYTYSFHLLLSVVSCLIVLIRPTSIILIPIILFWNTDSLKQIKQRFRNLITFRTLLIWTISFFIIFLPQFIYWKYLTGSYITYSYPFGFSNLLSPKILEVLFSPNNGLLPYSSVIILILISFPFFIKKHRITGFYSLSVLLIIFYLSASWHDWRFGCSCGQRNITEYLSLLVFPLCSGIEKVISLKDIRVKQLIFIFIVLLTFISFKVNYEFFGCYFSGIWNWEQYLKTLFHPYSL